MIRRNIFLFLLALLGLGTAQADDIPYRQQMREIYRQLPVRENNIVFLGNSITDFGLWSEFFGDPSHSTTPEQDGSGQAHPDIVNRGLGGGHGWNMTLDEFNAGYTSFVKGKPSKVFFHCGKRDLDDNTASVTTVFSKYTGKTH